MVQQKRRSREKKDPEAREIVEGPVRRVERTRKEPEFLGCTLLSEKHGTLELEMRANQIHGPVEDGDRIRLEVPREKLKAGTLFPTTFVNLSRGGAIVHRWKPPWYRRSPRNGGLFSAALALPVSAGAFIALLNGSGSGDVVESGRRLDGGEPGRGPNSGEPQRDGSPGGDAGTSLEVLDFVVAISIAVALTIAIFLVIYVLPRRRDRRRREEEVAPELT